MDGATPRLTLADFDYELPASLVAQVPAPRRDGSRLLRVDRHAGIAGHHAFADLPALLREGDLVVLNDTRVLPARLFGEKVGTGGRVELLLLRRLSATTPDDETWSALFRAAKPVRPGGEIVLCGGALHAFVEHREDDLVHVRLRPGSIPLPGASLPAPPSIAALIDQHGRLPLPPYINRPDDPADPRSAELDALDRTRYQTVFAARPGAVAAPTAGLHFTEELLATLAASGIALAALTLHVGPGTFRPVRGDDPTAHRMDPEPYEIPAATADAIATAKRVVAVGTTVARALEASGGRAGAADTDLFILPGHPWRVVGALLTNFHLPRSTLLMLIASLVPGWRAVYEEAVRAGYRFYSYGDAMLIE